MRINTSDDYAWRLDLYDRAADRLGENTRTRTIDESCAFTLAMLDNLEEAIDHPDMTPELADGSERRGRSSQIEHSSESIAHSWIT